MILWERFLCSRPHVLSSDLGYLGQNYPGSAGVSQTEPNWEILEHQNPVINCNYGLINLKYSTKEFVLREGNSSSADNNSWACPAEGQGWLWGLWLCLGALSKNRFWFSHLCRRSLIGQEWTPAVSPSSALGFWASFYSFHGFYSFYLWFMNAQLMAEGDESWFFLVQSAAGKDSSNSP